jgi:hypothetical protein
LRGFMEASQTLADLCRPRPPILAYFFSIRQKT